MAYQDIRRRAFTAVEQEIAWAASVWMPAYNAREEALCWDTCVGRDAFRAQASRAPPPGSCLARACESSDRPAPGRNAWAPDQPGS
jgi:hypothetical protein